MKLLRSAVSAALICLVLVAGAQPATSARRDPVLDRAIRSRTAAPRFAPDELLVRFRPRAARASVLAAAGARSHHALRMAGWERVALPAGTDVEEAAARLAADPAVEAVTPNLTYTALSAPDDTYFPLEWALNNTGQTVNWTTGKNDADIDAVEAWDITQGSSSVVVGVADTGVAYDHPDLAPNIWTNPGEIAGNGIDDDLNGFVDDVRGWDFYDDDNDPADQHTDSHGTHVAGTIGARGFDGYGVTGVSPIVSLMPLRVLSSTGSGNTLDIAEAFSYAAEHGAKVVNASLGGSGFDPYLYDTIKAASSTLFVVAAGNEGSNNDASPEYPCSFDVANVLCVAATTQSDGRASFSNYGKSHVDLGAPGENIASAYRPTTSAFSPQYSLADSPAGYANNTDSWAQKTNPADLTGLTGCQLRYELRASLRPGDSVGAERSIDGGATWVSLDLLESTQSTFNLRSRSLAADENPSVLVRFRFRSDGSGTDDGAYIDDAKVLCGATVVWSDNFDAGLGEWTTGGTNDSWGLSRVAGRWAYMNGTSMATPHVSGAAALLWALDPGASVAHAKNVLMGSVDSVSGLTGNTVTGGRLNARRALDYLPDATAPADPTIGSLPGYQRSTTFPVSWSATDTGAAGARKRFDVRYKRSRYDGAFGSTAAWKTWTATTGTTAHASAGMIYCFLVRARDGAWNMSAFGDSRCTTTPVNDRSMSASASWVRKTSSSRYLGTYTYGSATGATLRLGNVRYKRLALMVTKCSGCGTVDVYKGSTKLGRFSLNASKTLVKQFISVSTRTSRSTPVTITIKIVSSRKPVLIEGLGVQAV